MHIWECAFSVRLCLSIQACWPVLFMPNGSELGLRLLPITMAFLFQLGDLPEP